MLFEQNVASIWQLETRKMDIFEQKTGISGEIFWFELENEFKLELEIKLEIKLEIELEIEL